MSFIKNYALDTRTCGQAAEDDQLDKRDGLTRRITANRARWAAAHKRIDALDAARARTLPVDGMDAHHEWEE